MTSQQFQTLENTIHDARNNLDNLLKKLLSEAPNFTKETLNATHLSGSEFFSKFESFITSASSDYDSLSQLQIQDMLTSIENVLNFSIEYWKIMKKVSVSILNHEYQPQDNFLQTSQAVLKTYKKNKAQVIQNEFEKNNLPTNGFKVKEKYKLKSSKIDIPLLLIGIIFLIATGLITFITLINTGMQYWLTRILGSLGVAFILSSISKHKIQTKFNISGSTITATGAIAIFLSMYLVNPNNEPQYNVAKDNGTNIINNGSNTTIILQKEIKQSFLKSFLIEQKSNLSLLNILSTYNTDFLQKLSFQPQYLNTNFISSFDIYKNIKDEQVIAYLVELKRILKKINSKIEILHQANIKMLTGNLQNIQNAIIDFSSVKSDAQEALILYQKITDTYNKYMERNK